MNGTAEVRPDAERLVRVGEVEICTQTFGAAADPPILLIGGAEASMDWWEDGFCSRLAAAGRYVVRFDTRDTGRSTTFPVGAPTYGGEDLIADVVGLLDALGLGSAHLVGISMGGGMAQVIAARHPGRVDSLTLIATSPAAPGGPDRPELPPMSEELARKFAEPQPGPDWSDRESVLSYFLAGEHTFAGAIPVDEERVRRVAGRAFDRSPAPAAAANHWLLDDGKEQAALSLGDITAPTLVLHGTHDPLFPYAHGEALAREIPGARLVPLQGMGHQMPPPELWDMVIAELVPHTGAAAR
ncbi:alpha/beta fold hydrolase [Streptomyces sp. NBC_01808]|uniref:alpha/beta fold hydrolase n=1 Tax=Streptomyces sp. NBC_01808 TaxID=2975947 RepID=UPI002DDA9B15|nr:alpha/beta hydrolase [Streptomyces sp. NBC_01808]WSA38988.1 alpha/beta fold hydrolase [Streptomyces sp. NBC_01808]